MPGFRELRAPLAAGYLWLLFAWLMWGDELPDEDQISGVVARIYELGPVVSDVGRAVVASVAAFLLGSILIDVQVALGKALGALYFRVRFDRVHEVVNGVSSVLARVRGRPKPLPRPPLSVKPANFPVTQAGEDTMEALIGSGLDNVARQQAMIEGRVWLYSNRGVLKTRLLDVSAPLHSEVDRPDAEATLRMTLWPPLVALVVCLAWRASWIWVAALAVPSLIAWQWLSLRRHANDALVTAIVARDELNEEFTRNVVAERTQVGRASEAGGS
jgi:hypothetical protein